MNKKRLNPAAILLAVALMLSPLSISAGAVYYVKQNEKDGFTYVVYQQGLRKSSPATPAPAPEMALKAALAPAPEKAPEVTPALAPAPEKAPETTPAPEVVTALAPVIVPAVEVESLPRVEEPCDAYNAPSKFLSVPLFSEPQTLKLPRNITSFWFRIPDKTVLGDNCSVTLVLSATETLLEDYSTITLMLGDVQIATCSILEIINVNGGKWTVAIPAERLKTDGTLNELRIITAQRSILGDCADIDNPANWVRLEKTSRLNLDIIKMGPPVLGEALTYLLDRVDQHNRIGAQFLLPKDGGAAVSSAMLTVASAMGAAYPAKDNVSFYVSDKALQDAETNRVYIGMGEQLPFGIVQAPAIDQDDGYISIGRSGDYSEMFLYGSNSTGLAKAGAFFTHSKYLAQLSGTYTTITTDLSDAGAKPSKNEEGYYTLEDFGYNTVNLAGAFHQEITYTIRQPYGIRSGADSYVEIRFRHSKALVADTSLLTVYVNNVAVNSIQLSGSNAQGGSLKAVIPAEALEKSAINIKVECYNYLGKLDCSKDYYDTAWTVIDKDSVIYFEPGDRSLPTTVRQFPVFDADTWEASPRAILLLPENSSKTMLETAVALACRAGQNSGAACRWEYAGSLDFGDASAADFLIIGSSGDILIPDEIAALLDILPGKDGYDIVGNIPVSLEALQEKIIVQAVRSPWNFYRKAYVVICPDGMESGFKRFVADRDNLNKLDGAVALIDKAGDVTVIERESSSQAVKVPLTLERAVSRLVLYTGIPRTGLLIIASLIIVIIILIIIVSNNRRRFEKAKKKMELINADAGKTTDEDDSPDDFIKDKNER